MFHVATLLSDGSSGLPIAAPEDAPYRTEEAYVMSSAVDAISHMKMEGLRVQNDFSGSAGR